MERSSPHEVSLLLRACSGGDRAALDELMPVVYDELHRRAHRYMIRERAGATLQTTALVNEACLRLVTLKRIDWQDRTHFFAVAATFMRRILVDFARSRGYQKRGGEAQKVSIDPALLPCPEAGVEMIEIDHALTAPYGVRPEKSQGRETAVFWRDERGLRRPGFRARRSSVTRDWPSFGF